MLSKAKYMLQYGKFWTKRGLQYGIERVLVYQPKSKYDLIVEEWRRKSVQKLKGTGNLRISFDDVRCSLRVSLRIKKLSFVRTSSAIRSDGLQLRTSTEA